MNVSAKAMQVCQDQRLQSWRLKADQSLAINFHLSLCCMLWDFIWSSSFNLVCIGSIPLNPLVVYFEMLKTPKASFIKHNVIPSPLCIKLEIIYMDGCSAEQHICGWKKCRMCGPCTFPFQVMRLNTKCVDVYIVWHIRCQTHKDSIFVVTIRKQGVSSLIQQH